MEFSDVVELNTAVIAGKNFVSMYMSKPSNAFNDEGRYSRAYTNTRGILIEKSYVENTKNIDLTKGYQFQFNPQTISDVKSTFYDVRPYTGLAYNDYIWSGGGERTIRFSLFLDNTPQSKQVYFRPQSYGSSLATEFKTEGTGYSRSADGKYTLDNRTTADRLKETAQNFKERMIPSKGPSSFEYVSNGAFSISRVHERGVLPEVEKLQSFLYPAPLAGEETPKFAEGGVVSSNQFRPPAHAILAIGPLYLEGVVKSASVEYTLFDKDLTPIRAYVDIDFGVFEFKNVERRIEWKAY